jgi:hypothetical protein
MSVRNSDLSATVPGYMAIVIEVLNYAWQYRPAGVWGLAAMGRRWEARRRRSARVAPPLSPRLGGHAASAGRAWRAPGLDGTRRSENRCPLTSPAKIKNWLRLCANVAGPECLLFTPKRLPGDATERRSLFPIIVPGAASNSQQSGCPIRGTALSASARKAVSGAPSASWPPAAVSATAQPCQRWRTQGKLPRPIRRIPRLDSSLRSRTRRWPVSSSPTRA